MTRLRDIAGRYQTFLVDQFGVLHDGVRAFPGAVEALSRLHADGRRVVILSNSGKRSAANIARFAALGFGAETHDLFLTSGEVAFRRFAEGARPARVFIIARDGDRSVIDGLGIACVDDPASADLVLIAGSEAERVTLDAYRDRLAGAARAGVPALCINPDRSMLVRGGLYPGAGAIADAYAVLGGPVDFIGKPHPAIYRAAAELVGVAGAMIGIGDSLDHDVAGARAVGAAAALVVATGVHRGETDLEVLFQRHGMRPDHVIERFLW